jgi:uncharacterized protein (DUF2147 family)
LVINQLQKFIIHHSSLSSMKKGFILTIQLFVVVLLQAQSPIGTWKTIDDATREAKSYIEISESGGLFSGKVTKFLRADADPNRKCDKCTDSRKGQLILGMTIVKSLRKSGAEWKGGTILDPEKGQEYKCTIWFEGGKTDVLQVRGYHWSGLWRTQTWYRVK